MKNEYKEPPPLIEILLYTALAIAIIAIVCGATGF